MEETAVAPTPTFTAPRTVLLLPVAYLVHLAEEWFGGFVEWTRTVLAAGVSSERFVLINSIAFVVFVLGTVAAYRSRRMAWFGVTLAALLGLNGVVHGLLTVALGVYSPGTATGLAVYVPLAYVVLRSYSTVLTPSVFRRSLWIGVLLHVVVVLLAWS